MSDLDPIKAEALRQAVVHERDVMQHIGVHNSTVTERVTNTAKAFEAYLRG